MTLKVVEYYYLRNGQNDIIGLVDKTGTQVVSYTYDSWGKLISIDGSLKSTVGAKNPYRYRGYRYDTETGLYYLNSRYYNPEWGRFINADGLVSTGQDIVGHNMFAYCLNNPVNMRDEDGFLGAYLTSIGVGAAIGGISYGISALVTGKFDGKQFALAVATGAISSAVAPLATIRKLAMAASAVISGVSNAISKKIEKI